MIDDRRWIRDTLAHRLQEAVPYNFMFSPPARSALQRHFGAETSKRRSLSRYA